VIRRRPVAARSAGIVVLCALALPAAAFATRINQRTLLVSDAVTSSANGPSGSPAITEDGQWVSFSSSASNLGTVDLNNASDVYFRNTRNGAIGRLSAGPAGTDANGPSGEPSIASGLPRVAFTSFASNLVAGDTNGVNDIFWTEPGAPVQRVSSAADGGPANAASGQPDISGDGRYVAFASYATNLVAGDTNGKRDVFVRDLVTNTTRRVSVARDGGSANEASGAPAISQDGRYVAFTSAATNLVANDRNKRIDVFVRDLTTNKTERVSVSSTGVAQNAAVAAPFATIVDISGDGRYVVWDSDATNLVAGDRNGRTDVFLRDRKNRTTTRVSVDGAGAQADNDSFAPAISANGESVAFVSLADTLAPGDSSREDVFLRDLKIGATSVVAPAADGGRPVASGPVVLDRPAVGAGGNAVAIASAADNLVGRDFNGVADIFVRRMDAPTATVLSAPKRRQKQGGQKIRLASDDPAANLTLCKVDRTARTCTLTPKLPKFARGLHDVSYRLGGPGLRYDPKAVSFVVGRDRQGPALHLVTPADKSTVRSPVTLIAGTASDPSGISRVVIAAGAITPSGCVALTGGTCLALKYRKASGTTTWSLRIRGLKAGYYGLVVRAFDGQGNKTERKFVFIAK
jgi:Tol biopolymer transport system component